MKSQNEGIQEIFVKLNVETKAKQGLLSLSWRDSNLNPIWVTNVIVNNDSSEVSFTSEFNLNSSKEDIIKFIENDSQFTICEGFSLATLNVKVLEIQEEAEIYAL